MTGEASKKHAPWTRDEIATLQREWAQVGWRVLRERLPARSHSAIYRKAHELGLVLSRSQGLVSIQRAADKLGIGPRRTLALCERFEVKTIRKHPSPTSSAWRSKQWRVLVDFDELVEAFKVWLREETIVQAARRLRVSRARLSALSGKPTKRKGAGYRLLPEQWDEIAKGARR